MREALKVLPRSFVFALLLLAASAVLAQPVCAASEPCCAELEVMVSAAPDVAASAGLPPLFVAAWVPRPRSAVSPRALAGRLSALSPPPLLPYYARSARILR
jgi:hypothetical protein